MTVTLFRPLLQLLRGIQRPHSLTSTDEELLQRFRSSQDEGAFEAMLYRHGPMVLDVCRSLLPNSADAEDAFQATFLILARKAACIRNGAALAGFLHGVAYRTALKARRRFACQKKHEARCPQPDAAAPDDPTWSEVRQILHEELAGLSERLRAPLVLCYLEGRTQAESAGRLGISQGTLKRRLESGRALLRARLVRRGISSAFLALAAWPGISAAVPAPLMRATVQAGPLFAAGDTSMLSSQVVTLAQWGSRSLFGAPLKLLTVTALSLLMAGIGLGIYLVRTEPAGNQQQADRAKPKADQPLRIERDSDPLPAQAVVRLGTQRFRSDSWVSRVRVVPGGKQLLGLGAHSVILWDAETGKEIRRFVGPTMRKVDSTGYGVSMESFAVSPDGKSLAVGTTDGSKLDCPILLFDLATGKRLSELAGHKSDGWSANSRLAFVTPTLLVSAGSDGARLHDVTSRAQVRTLEADGLESISSLLPVAGVKQVLGVGGEKKSVGWRIWETATGKVVHSESGLSGNFIAADLSPDGRMLAVAVGVGEAHKVGGSNEVRIYAAPKWYMLKRWKSHAGRFPQRNAVAFAPDGKSLATGGADQKVRRWSLEGKEIGSAIEPYVYANNVIWLDQETLITFDAQNAIKLWNAKTGKPVRDFPGSEAHLTALDYSPDGRFVATGGGGGDATVRVWEVRTGKLAAHLRARMSDVTCVRFSSDGSRLATSDSGGVARVWDWRAGRELHAFHDHAPWLHCVAFSPDGKQLATGDDAGIVRVWDLGNGKLIHALRGHERAITALVFSSTGTALFSGSWDHSIRRWSLTTGKQVFVIRGIQSPVRRQEKPVGHTSVVTSLALSPGGQWLYSGSMDHTICVWEADSGCLCRVLKGTERGYSSVAAITLSANGTLLAAALGDRGQEASIHIWDVLSSKKVKSLPGHRGTVTQVCFSPAGKRLASCSTDTTALIWDAGDLVPRATREPSDQTGLWQDLGSADPEKAYAAVCRGAAASTRAVAAVEHKLKPLAAVDQSKVLSWVRRLDSSEFKEREQAARALAGLGPDAAEPLEKLASEPASAEVKRRLRAILDRFAKEQRRDARAIEMLEMIGSQEAQRVLEKLAGGVDGAFTRQAAAALKRAQTRK